MIGKMVTDSMTSVCIYLQRGKSYLMNLIAFYNEMVKVIKQWNRLPKEAVAASLVGEIQNLIGHSPEQPALAEPALSRETAHLHLQRSFPFLAIV